MAPIRQETAPALELSAVRLVVDGGERLVAVPATVSGLDGPVVDADGEQLRLVRPTAAAAARLRELVPALRPRTFGAQGSSFGFGDRIGRATPGHVAALRATATRLRPVLAQQSARELARTGRSFRDVLDAATWGVVETGWEDGYAADADHLTSAPDVRAALDAGFTMITLDPSAHVDEDAADAHGSELGRRVEALPWDRLAGDWNGLRRRHERSALIAGGSELAVARAAAVYGGALAHVRELAGPLAGIDVDVEISVDETERPTTPFEHAFLALELERLGVRFTSIAPRFPGRWEKGVDVAGEPTVLRKALAAHLAVAQASGGHKVSVHSGSDKPSVYAMLAEAGDGAWHVKTSGTSYLEALRVVAAVDPPLFREILELAATALAEERRSYAIAATAGIPCEPVPDDDLPGLLDAPDVRQCLHVTYGAVLGGRLAGRLDETLDGAAPTYTETLAGHFANHLRPLGGLA